MRQTPSPNILGLQSLKSKQQQQQINENKQKPTTKQIKSFSFPSVLSLKHYFHVGQVIGLATFPP